MFGPNRESTYAQNIAVKYCECLKTQNELTVWELKPKVFLQAP